MKRKNENVHKYNGWLKNGYGYEFTSSSYARQ